MRVKIFPIDRQDVLEKYEEQVNELLRACEQQWEVVDADLLLDPTDPGGRSYLVIKYNQKD